MRNVNIIREKGVGIILPNVDIIKNFQRYLKLIHKLKWRSMTLKAKEFFFKIYIIVIFLEILFYYSIFNKTFEQEKVDSKSWKKN